MHNTMYTTATASPLERQIFWYKNPYKMDLWEDTSQEKQKDPDYIPIREPKSLMIPGRFFIEYKTLRNRIVYRK